MAQNDARMTGVSSRLQLRVLHINVLNVWAQTLKASHHAIRSCRALCCWSRDCPGTAFIAHSCIFAELAFNLIKPCWFRQVCSMENLSPPLMQAQEFHLHNKSESFQHTLGTTSFPINTFAFQMSFPRGARTPDCPAALVEMRTLPQAALRDEGQHFQLLPWRKLLLKIPPAPLLSVYGEQRSLMHGITG